MEVLARFFTENVNLLNLLVSTALNTFFVWVIVHYFYYPKGRRRDYYFSFILMSISVFALIYLLLGSDKSVGTGVALGLFAIFSIVRYRTESVPIREMTYLFLLVALSVMNGKIGSSLYFLEHSPLPKDPERMVEVPLNPLDGLLVTMVYIIGLSLLFIFVIWVAEKLLQRSYTEGCKYVRYDNIELIRPDRYDELVADLSERLGVEIDRVEVGAVDFLKDMTMLRVFYRDSDARIKPVDRMFRLPRE
ncbi:MAG: DUF4956 domain-containing protein [Bacteroidales bacterium]|nr:DUF4956 domain-containing protein [Bacteroidales bacterium]